MKVKFWGVRGSLPSSSNPLEAKDRTASLLKKFLEKGYKSVEQIEKFLNEVPTSEANGYGIATTCVQVKSDEQSIIIDGGSGIKFLSDYYAKHHFKQNEYHILMTHFHFDHILGLPFFMPHFLSGKKITYYSVQPECERVVRSLFHKPIFPVGYDQLKANIEFVCIKPYEQITINGFSVTPYLLDHPDPCYGYRIEKNGKSYGHAVDTEAVRLTESKLGIDAMLYKNLDLLYIDAQYSEDDMDRKQGWGHGTFSRAFELSSQFNVKQVCMGHFDPSASFEDVEILKDKAQLIYSESYAKSKFQWCFAYETQEIEI